MVTIHLVHRWARTWPVACEGYQTLTRARVGTQLTVLASSVSVPHRFAGMARAGFDPACTGDIRPTYL